MKRLFSFFLIIFISLIHSHFALALERLLYLTPDGPQATFSRNQLQQIAQHADQITLLGPQIYRLDAAGHIAGHLDNALVQLARQHHIGLMPLIINPDFNQAFIHHFLHQPNQQQIAINEMLALCQQYQLSGIQFDFENISYIDKAAYSHFVEIAAKTLHYHGFKLSVAVIPRTSDQPQTPYDYWLRDNWSGAYDYATLAKAADFISLMSYDQHTSLTTPGPLAAADWVKAIINYTLTQVPANKISLGIPTYSALWSTGQLSVGEMPTQYTFRAKRKALSYPSVIELTKNHSYSLVWHKKWQSFYSLFSQNQNLDYLFVEDAKSFQAKLLLAKYYHLAGLSIWKLGFEDKRIWNLT